MKLKQLSYSLFACLACSNLSVNANEALSDDLFNLPIEQLMQLEVASATLSNESLIDVPSSVAVYNRDEIQKLGLDNLDELLNFVTGMHSARSDRDGKFSRVSARGRASGSGGGEILILLNGQRINSEYSGANDYTFPLIPLSIAEKIEFIKGPGSSIYGSNAFLGVINIITITDATPQLSVEAGNMSLQRVSASAGYSKGAFSAQGIVSYASDDGDHYHGELDSFNPSVKHKLDDPIQHQELLLNLKYDKSSLQFVLSEQESRDFYVQGIIGNDFNKAKNDSVFITFNQQLEWNEKLNTDIWLDYRNNQSDINILGLAPNVFAPISTPSSTAPLLAKSPVHETAKGLRVNNFYQYNDDIRLSLGFEHRTSKLNEDHYATNFNYAKCLLSEPCVNYLLSGGQQIPDEHPNIEYYGDDFSGRVKFTTITQRNINGAFVQAQIKVNQNTQVTIGGRYDKYSDIGDNTSPRVSIVNNTLDKVTFKLNYGEAYRAPQFNELGLLNNPLIQGNENLNPEIVKSFDFISLIQFENLSVSATLFQHKIEDAILAESRDNNRLVLSNQSDVTTTRGIEAEVTYIPNSQYYFKAGLTHLFDKGRDQFRESDNLLFLIGNYSFENFNLNVSANYHDEKHTVSYQQQEDNLTNLDSYWVVNTKITYQLDNSCALFIKAKNLLDNDYRTPAIGNRAYAGVPNRGRQWSIGAEFAF
ncbi:ferrienterochelin/colicin outer membrane receptor [Catenovulum agarivorans DS-2]|uniref:Ferrienterochelin/colicin outer membrane receptor n=1 Tax=Catenovulum agarivorans DS-2 TaxID=1328313 RepID=W7QGY2_9ALTE|nr:TonB-dependent receptor [Catenovulum agarivorans]EWH08197.1 ferrienterochelin/colicin outer membrane receptor [Catenovulum agarivorans DS-2]